MTLIERGLAFDLSGQVTSIRTRQGERQSSRSTQGAVRWATRRKSEPMTQPDARLQGKRILVVEDEMLVALLIEDLLIDLGCIVLGPFDTVATALRAALMEGFDLALLDVNVAGEKVFPVADALAARHIPFLFLSGYGASAIPPGHAAWKVCSKPFKGNELTDMLLSLVADSD
jgi:CheY-like chemotaxis protein